MPVRQGSDEAPAQEATVIPNQESLIGDLLSMDLGGSTISSTPAPVAAPTSNVDLLGGGLDILVKYCVIKLQRGL